ncbi:hypothetical protein BO82DRAFT_401010 [Aspergillus uvarum CBS 121591]|uniref:Uncharacterized protein n=1 Tax=Aspergillus uvarum CBS 121591 TaxID=1448315 RepID=A0A319CFB0_9EURO|nr:hypothetical protein BO82DRAFT_401010 [Aspergillus uvarum CBS 121591]PYH82989.1 hypothetical protein BO82DRAFT_401010 [Aspergillus uvarum CBS 121591]
MEVCRLQHLPQIADCIPVVQLPEIESLVADVVLVENNNNNCGGQGGNNNRGGRGGGFFNNNNNNNNNGNNWNNNNNNNSNGKNVKKNKKVNWYRPLLDPYDFEDNSTRLLQGWGFDGSKVPEPEDIEMTDAPPLVYPESDDDILMGGVSDNEDPDTSRGGWSYLESDSDTSVGDQSACGAQGRRLSDSDISMRSWSDLDSDTSFGDRSDSVTSVDDEQSDADDAEGVRFELYKSCKDRPGTPVPSRKSSSSSEASSHSSDPDYVPDDEEEEEDETLEPGQQAPSDLFGQM